MKLNIPNLPELTRNIRQRAEDAKRQKAYLHERLRVERQCREVKRNGERCRAWSVWGDESMRCSRHGGKGTGSSACRCRAYKFPHRRRSGLCRFPDEPAGSHDPPPVRRRRKRKTRIIDWIRQMGLQSAGE